MTPENPVENKVSDKELNFRKQEQYFQGVIREKDAVLAQREAELARLQNVQVQEPEEEDDTYIDKKKLDKNLNRFGEKQRKEIQSDIQRAINEAVEKDREERWLKQNPDFYQVLNENAEKFANHDQELAETILRMPKGFEREKLVYKSIKALGLDKPHQNKPSIQDQIDQKKKGYYYQPSSVPNAPYQSPGDYSPEAQKSSYEKMQKLKNNLRLG